MSSKTCSKCGVEKLTSDFYKRSSRKNSIYPECKNCFGLRIRKSIRLKKQRAIEYLGGKCVDCDQVFHPAIYDFHHMYDKDMEWYDMQKRSLAKILPELDKCILLCSNCHRMRHINEDGWTSLVPAVKPKPKSKSNTAITRRKTMMHKNCMSCGRVFSYTKNGSKERMTCSPECGHKSQHKIQWPDNLPELVQARSKRAVAAELGVSDKAVAKRLRNHHGW